MAGSGTLQLRDPSKQFLRAEHLEVQYRVRGATLQAVSDVSFDIEEGETLGLVGESGCGKSTTGASVMMLPPPTSGRITIDGKEVTSLGGRELRDVRRQVQMIFQDPISSLNPRRKVRDIVAEGLGVWKDKANARDRVEEMMLQVGLDPEAVGDRRPHEFSGGQCQRIAIARALMLQPDLLICDEPVSALDVSVQAKILNVLEEMRVRYGLTVLFVSHDLAVVKVVCSRLAVMYLGKLCEIGASEAIYQAPKHPYTQALLEAIPRPDPGVRIEPLHIDGEMPSPLAPPSGCRFRTRCPRAEARCAAEEPQMRQVGDDQFVACHFPL